MVGVGLKVVTIFPKTVAEDDRVHSIVEEIGNKIGTLRANIESIVSASRRQDHRGARVDAAFHRVHLDGWVMDVNYAVDPSRHGLAHVILLRLANSIVVEKRRVSWVQRNDYAALQNRLGRIRRIVCRPGRRYRKGRSDRTQSRGVRCQCGFSRVVEYQGNKECQWPGR